MKAFISASAIKAKKEEIDGQKVEAFIVKFNEYVLEGNEDGDNFYLNNITDAIPALTDNEFKLAIKLAESQGWNLTRINDQHQSTTYKMKKTTEN